MLTFLVLRWETSQKLVYVPFLYDQSTIVMEQQLIAERKGKKQKAKIHFFQTPH